MSELVAKTVRLPQDLWDKLQEKSKDDERSVNWELIQAVKAYVVKVIPDVGKVVSPRYQVDTKVVLPTPSPEPVSVGTNLALKDLKKKKRERKKETPVSDGIAERVIAEINRLRPLPPRKKPFMVKTWGKHVDRLVKDKFSEEEIIEVVHWRADECSRTGNWEWISPDHLFKPTLFAEKLGKAQSGVEYGVNRAKPKQKSFFTGTPDYNPNAED